MVQQAEQRTDAERQGAYANSQFAMGASRPASKSAIRNYNQWGPYPVNAIVDH